jgi:hypothetical protein
MAVTVAPSVLGGLVQAVRVSRLHCEFYDGSIPSFAQITSTVLPSFVGGGTGSSFGLTVPAQTWTTVIPGLTSVLSGGNLSFPTFSLQVPTYTVAPINTILFPTYQLFAGGVACTFPITSGFRLDALGNLQVGSTAPFTPVVWNPTAGTSGIITAAPTGNTTMTSFSVPAVNIPTTTFNVAMTGTYNTTPNSSMITTEPTYNITGGIIWSGLTLTGSGSLTLQAVSADERVLVNLGCYVSRLTQSTGRYSLKDPLNQTMDASVDFLDLITDVFQPVYGFGHGSTSRKWEVTLPYPIVLEAGEALVVTISLKSFSGIPRNVVAFVRALVSDVV